MSEPVRLRVRPRWQRVFFWPRLVYRYWRDVGIPLRESMRMANMAVTFKGKWVR